MEKNMRASLDQEQVKEEFDKYHDHYSETVNNSLIVPGMDVDYFSRVKADFLVDHLGGMFPAIEKLSVLDIGCGVGNYHGLLANKFQRLVGVDVSPLSVEQARKAHPSSEFFDYGGKQLPFEDDSFDVAFAICVVHHVPSSQWPQFFDEAFRILKYNGVLLIFEHNPNNPLTMRIVNRCPFDKDAVLLRQAMTNALLSDAGFDEVNSRTILNVPSMGRLSRKLDYALGVLPTGAQYLATGRKSRTVAEVSSRRREVSSEC